MTCDRERALCPSPDIVEIRWPSGAVDTLNDLDVDRLYVILATRIQMIYSSGCGLSGKRSTARLTEAYTCMTSASFL